jgi:hypothetical protein
MKKRLSVLTEAACIGISLSLSLSLSLSRFNAGTTGNFKTFLRYLPFALTKCTLPLSTGMLHGQDERGGTYDSYLKIYKKKTN